MSDPLPGKGFLGWLGRQVGYVSHAVKSKPAHNPPPQPSKVVYREGRVEEVAHPTQGNILLRRTIIDEVVVEEPEKQSTNS